MTGEISSVNSMHSVDRSAPLDDELDGSAVSNVTRRIPLKNDQICHISGLNAADFVVDAESSSPVLRGHSNDLQGRNARVSHKRHLVVNGETRYDPGSGRIGPDRQCDSGVVKELDRGLGAQVKIAKPVDATKELPHPGEGAVPQLLVDPEEVRVFHDTRSPQPKQSVKKVCMAGLCYSIPSAPYSGGAKVGAYRNGTTLVLFEPLDFIARLVALGHIETCSACGGAVKVIASIEDPEVINQILAHLAEKAATTRLPPTASFRRAAAAPRWPGTGNWRPG